MAPGLAAGPPGIAVAMRSGGSDCPVEPPLSWVEDPYFFWGVLSFCMPRIFSRRLSGFVTVNQQLLDPGSPGIIALHVQEFIHIDFQLRDLLFLSVVEASELLQNPLLQVEALP